MHYKSSCGPAYPLTALTESHLHVIATCSVHAESLRKSSADAHGPLASCMKTEKEKEKKKKEKEKEVLQRGGGKFTRKNHRMKPRCLLSSVVRLPTISEMQESDVEDGEPDCSSQTMEEYVDSIKELSQPALYPLHGPLRGHRRWMLRSCIAVTPVLLNSSRTSVDLSDVSLTLTDQSNCDAPSRFRQNLLDMLVAQSPFAGLV